MQTMSFIKKMWQDVMPLYPVIKKIESNPGLITIVPPSTMSVLVTIESRIGIVQGMTNICYPYFLIKALSELKKQKSEQNKNDFLQKNPETLMVRKIHQFTIGKHTITSLIRLNGKTNILLPENLKSIEKYAQVLSDVEDAGV